MKNRSPADNMTDTNLWFCFEIRLSLFFFTLKFLHFKVGDHLNPSISSEEEEDLWDELKELN